jgi:hypothetical protein
MVHRLIARRIGYASDECVGQVGPKSQFGRLFAVPEVERYGLPYDNREGGSLGSRPVLKLPIRLFSESQIGDSIPHHSDITISQSAGSINREVKSAVARNK